jgi:excisionase family DNA binding protein
MVQTPERVILRIRDLARIFGCSPIAARRMVERGELPSRRLGRRLVVLADELDTYLKALPSGALPRGRASAPGDGLHVGTDRRAEARR